MRLGERLRSARKSLGHLQREAAAIIGTDNMSVSRWEGGRGASPKYAAAIERYIALAEGGGGCEAIMAELRQAYGPRLAVCAPVPKGEMVHMPAGTSGVLAFIRTEAE